MIKHVRLKKQLKYLNLTDIAFPKNLKTWQTFLSCIDKSYVSFDKKQAKIQLAFEKELSEMHALNHSIKIETVNKLQKNKSLLKEEKKYVSEVLEAMPGLFYRLDEKGYVIQWNKNVEIVCGYSTEELSKMHILDFFEKNNKYRIDKQIEKIYQEGLSTFEANVIYKNQMKAAYFFSGKQSSYKGKKCIIAMAYEISEHKKTEMKLLERIEELSRWHAVTLARERRILELKQEVNQLLQQAGHPLRYGSATFDDADIKDIS